MALVVRNKTPAGSPSTPTASPVPAKPPSTTASPRPTHALRLLSLDGGGIRGVSELVILEEIMHRVGRAEGIPDGSTLFPADYFDLICGASTGGLIALLLGRLRLTVPQAIEKYINLAKQVFSEKKNRFQDGTFKASNLEEAIKGVVKEQSGDENERMWTTQEGCKTFVCAIPAKHIDKTPTLFRTWSADTNPGHNCTIWEAGRATSAAPTFFKRISIGDQGFQEEFVDAGMGCNNPVEYLMKEARKEFDQHRQVSCILSIGTGKQKVVGFTAPGLLQRALPSKLVEVLKQIATDSEDQAKRMEERYQHCSGLYHRLNVERGLEDVALQDWEKLGDVRTHTSKFMNERNVSKDVDVIVQALVGKNSSSETFRLNQLDGTAVISNDGPFSYPKQRVNHFVSRTLPQTEIQKHFRSSRNNAMPTVVVLLGMGGCGKSQLALEYCQQSQNDKSYSCIFWIDAMSTSTAKQSLSAVAQELSKPDFNAVDVEGNVRYALKTISAWQAPWLLVFDNFDDPQSFASIKDYFPQSNRGSILVTSRDRSTESLGHHIDVTNMSDDEAVELLLRRSEKAESEGNRSEAHGIVKTLGFHALAIDQAGAYILRRKMDLHLYLKHYDDRKERVLDETPKLWDYSKKQPKKSPSSPEGETLLSVYTTWELSFDLISGGGVTREDKEYILTLLAFFDRNEISDALFPPYATEDSSWMASCRTGSIWDKCIFQDILADLHDLSLIQNLKTESSGAVVSLHPLVQEWIKLRISIKSRQEFTFGAAMILRCFLESQKFQEMGSHVKQTMLFHTDAITQNDIQYFSQQAGCESQLSTAAREELLRAITSFASFNGYSYQWEKFESLARHVFEEGKLLFGEEHPNMGLIMGNYALGLSSVGKYEDAELMARRTLFLRRKILGTKHIDTITTMLDLAIYLHHGKKHSESQTLFREAIALSKKFLGEEHQLTLRLICDLGHALCDHGKYSEAETTLQEILVVQKRLLGKDDPTTIKIIRSLGRVLQLQGNFSEAEPLLREELAWNERCLGKDASMTLSTMCLIGELLYHQGKCSEAKSMLREVLARDEEGLDSTNRLTVPALRQLAEIAISQKRFEEAKPILLRLLDLSSKLHGDEYRITLQAKFLFAILLYEQSKYNEAESNLRQIHPSMESVLGKEDADTIKCADFLASAVMKQGRYNEAELLYQETLLGMEKNLGLEDESTLDCVDGLFISLVKQEKYGEAEVLSRKTWLTLVKVHGTGHENTLEWAMRLAEVLRAQGKYKNAELTYKRTLALMEKALGKEHESTRKCTEKLAECTAERGNE